MVVTAASSEVWVGKTVMQQEGGAGNLESSEAETFVLRMVEPGSMCPLLEDISVTREAEGSHISPREDQRACPFFSSLPCV